MARNLRQYLVDENTPVSPEWVSRVFGDIDARIDALEQIKADWQAAVDALTHQALRRIDEALRPAFEEVQALTSVGAFFTATSASDVAVGTGLKTFIVDEPRKNFVPAEYVVVSSAGDPNIGMAGRLVSYDPETGELVVNVELASGAGSRSDWRISVGTPPDLTHAGRTDNPHGVTWDQVGAAAAVHGHQISDVTGLQGALDAKAASVHGHQIADVSGLEAALAEKLDDAAGIIQSHHIADGAITSDKIEDRVDYWSGALYWPGCITGMLLHAAHGLGQTPRVFGALLECTSPEGGYAVGDRVMLPIWARSGVGEPWATGTEIGYSSQYYCPHLTNKDGSTWFFPSSANWVGRLWAML